MTSTHFSYIGEGELKGAAPPSQTPRYELCNLLGSARLPGYFRVALRSPGRDRLRTHRSRTHVVEEYKRFLRTSFRFLDPHLREQFEQHLQGMDVLVRGPYVTLARDFERGRRLRELVDDGALDPGVLEAA